MMEPEQPKVRSSVTWPEAFLALGALAIVGVVVLGITWLILR